MARSGARLSFCAFAPCVSVTLRRFAAVIRQLGFRPLAPSFFVQILFDFP
jgi:hypothetical protein